MERMEGRRNRPQGRSAIKNVLTVLAVRISLFVPVFAIANYSEQSHT
ncbi:hypothetical protein QUB47_09300 [Microcoleus sp. AT9_B5]